MPGVDEEQVAVILAALSDTLEGESVDDGVSALLTLLWLICDATDLDVEEVADTFVRGAFTNALKDPMVTSEVGEA